MDYKTLTEKTEKRIITLMQQSGTQKEDCVARLYKGWAYGAYLLWFELTQHENRNEEDDKKLSQIIEGGF